MFIDAPPKKKDKKTCKRALHTGYSTTDHVLFFSLEVANPEKAAGTDGGTAAVHLGG